MKLRHRVLVIREKDQEMKVSGPVRSLGLNSRGMKQGLILTMKDRDQVLKLSNAQVMNVTIQVVREMQFRDQGLKVKDLMVKF
jgi:hypothetical protein